LPGHNHPGGQAEAELGPEALLGSLAILGSAGFYAWNIILMRQQRQVAGPVEIAFFTSLIMVGCFLLAAPVLAEVPSREHLHEILGAAALAFGSLLLLSWAMQERGAAPRRHRIYGFLWASCSASSSSRSRSARSRSSAPR
jgi:S-adenosylmethionine uptake transporter